MSAQSTSRERLTRGDAARLRRVSQRLRECDAKLDRVLACLETRPTPTEQFSPTTLTVEEFCSRNLIGRSTFFGLRRKGLGPAIMRIGTKVLVTIEAEADWRRKMQVDAAAPPRDNNRR